MVVKTLKNYLRPPLILLMTVEASILYSAIYFAVFVRSGDSFAQFEDVHGPIAPQATAVAVVMLIGLLSMGLYQFNQRIYFNEVIARVFVGCFIGYGLFALQHYLYPASDKSMDIYAIATGYSIILLLAVRYYFARHVDENIFRKRTLVYGAGKRAEYVWNLRRKADRRGFIIVGFVPAVGDSVAVSDEYLLKNGSSLHRLAIENDVAEIVVAMDNRRGNLPIDQMLECKLQGIAVTDLVEFLERETGRIWIDLVNPGWLIFGPGCHTSIVHFFCKRVIDIVVSLASLLILSPVLLLTAVAILSEGGWRKPILYRQVRVGFYGKEFELLKFRSMCQYAEPDGKAVWAEKNDKRVTRVGNFIRKARIDELPQLVNVLRGEMSLVGPRPERPKFVKDLSASVKFYSERHTIKPGLTGWAQVNYPYGSSEKDAIQKLQHDLYYVKNKNLLLDLVIMLQTLEVVLWGKGAR